MTNGIFRWLTVAIFIVSLPVLIITTNVKALMLDPGFYDSVQARNGVLASSGLPAPVLAAANRSLVSFFEERTSSLDSELTKQNLPADYFNKRESDHLADVKSLVWMVMAAQQMTLGYVILFLVATSLFSPRRILKMVRGPFVLGAGLTLALLVVFGILSQIDFSGLFLVFHIVSFSNDLWMLNPSTDNLLKMFPEAFWFNAAISMAVYSAAEALAVGAVGALLYWRRLGVR